MAPGIYFSDVNVAGGDFAVNMDFVSVILLDDQRLLIAMKKAALLWIHCDIGDICRAFSTSLFS